VLDDDLYLPTNLPPDDPRSELAIPIIYSGEVLGVLDIQSRQPETFTENDIELFVCSLMVLPLQCKML
jgi:putative methionine-R-sulfoxide reductase with GAF domain